VVGRTPPRVVVIAAHEEERGELEGRWGLQELDPDGEVGAGIEGGVLGRGAAEAGDGPRLRSLEGSPRGGGG